MTAGCRGSGFIAVGEERVKDGSRSPASAHLHHNRHTCSTLGACTILYSGTERHSRMNTHLHTSKTPCPEPLRWDLYTLTLPPHSVGVKRGRAGSPEPSSDCSLALHPQLGPQVPRLLQGAKGSTLHPSAASGQGSAMLTASPAALVRPCPPGNSYSALGAKFGPGEKERRMGPSTSGRGRRGWRVPRSPGATWARRRPLGAPPSLGPGPGRSSLAAPREALRRVQLHRLPPPHLALLPVRVRL